MQHGSATRAMEVPRCEAIVGEILVEQICPFVTAWLDLRTPNWMKETFLLTFQSGGPHQDLSLFCATAESEKRIVAAMKEWWENQLGTDKNKTFKSCSCHGNTSWTGKRLKLCDQTLSTVCETCSAGRCERALAGFGRVWIQQVLNRRRNPQWTESEFTRRGLYQIFDDGEIEFHQTNGRQLEFWGGGSLFRGYCFNVRRYSPDLISKEKVLSPLKQTSFLKFTFRSLMQLPLVSKRQRLLP